ncbi:MAG: antitoxin [Erysipelotrichia bacterium]|nr:antitoxin [Erysipelotrichia bacterium]
MNSKVAKLFDNGAILQSNIQEDDVFSMIEEQYGKSSYGTVKYSSNEMYWIGYIYRYFCFTYDLTSTQVYKVIKPKQLRGLYFAYHTLDPAQTIERIIEANDISIFDKYDIKKQYELFKKIRGKQ